MINIETIDKCIESLSEKADKTEKAVDALQLSQAASNLANTRACILSNPETKKD